MHRKFERTAQSHIFKTFWYILTPIFKQQLRRLRYTLGHILTTALGSAVTLTLFLYVFGDFLRDKLPQTNSAAAETIRFYLLFILILASSWGIYRWSHNLLRKPNGWVQFLSSLGCDPSHITRATLLAFLVISSIANILSIVVISQFLGPLRVSHLICLSLAIVISVLSSQANSKKLLISDTFTIQSRPSMNPESLVSWRQCRFKGSYWRGFHLRIISSSLIVVAAASLLTNKPIELSLVITLFAGIILSWIVPMAIEEDLRYTWLERQAAISHRKWIQAWQSIFTKWALIFFLTTFVIFLAPTLIITFFGFQKPSNGTTFHLLINAVIASFNAAFPIWLAPSFILQIDGRQIITNIILITLISIFIGTAVIAIPYLIPAIWLLWHEAHRYQEGRFARASYY
jgi:hypothetical protein